MIRDGKVLLLAALSWLVLYAVVSAEQWLRSARGASPWP